MRPKSNGPSSDADFWLLTADLCLPLRLLRAPRHVGDTFDGEDHQNNDAANHTTAWSSTAAAATCCPSTASAKEAGMCGLAVGVVVGEIDAAPRAIHACGEAGRQH